MFAKTCAIGAGYLLETKMGWGKEKPAVKNAAGDALARHQDSFLFVYMCIIVMADGRLGHGWAVP